MAYEPIDPKEAYDAKKFSEFVNSHRALKGGLELITKDPNSPDAVSIIGQTIKENPVYYSQRFPQNPGFASRVAASEYYKEGQSGLEGYLIKNALEIASDLKEDQSKSLLANVNVQTKEDKYKEYVKMLNERREITEAMRSNDPEKIGAYVTKALKGSSKAEQNIFGFLSGSQQYVAGLFRDYSQIALKKIEEYEKTLSGDDIKKLVEENVENAQKKKDKEFMNVLTEVAVPRPKEPAA